MVEPEVSHDLMVPPCPPPDGALSERNITDSVDQTSESDLNNFQVVKNKTTKKKEKHRSLEATEIMDSEHPSPLGPQPQQIKRMRLYFPSNTDIAANMKLTSIRKK